MDKQRRINIGIIAEYNPFHKGHLYQINKIKEKYPDSNIIVAMSGDFVQRGEPSIVNKEQRAKIAVMKGVNLILEIPSSYVLQSANKFAYAGVYLLNQFNVDYLAFGSESGDLNYLKDILKKQESINFDKNRSWNNNFRMNLEANDVLALEYLRNIKKINNKIKPLIIKRKNNKHNDSKVINNFASASKIREFAYQKNNDYKNYTEIDLSVWNSIYKYESIILFLIKNKENFNNIVDINDDLKNLIYKNRNKKSLNSLIDSCKNKYFSKSKIKRSLLKILLGIKKLDLEKINILGFDSYGQKILNNYKKNSRIVNKKNYYLNEIYQMGFEKQIKTEIFIKLNN